LIAPAAEDLTAFQEVSLDVNGKVQSFPQVGGEASTDYTTRSVDKSSMSYLSNSTGIVAFTDATANTIFFQAGIENLGVLTWGSEVSVGMSGNVIEINYTTVSSTECAFSVVAEDGVLSIFAVGHTANVATV